MGSEQFVYLDPSDPTRRLAPTVFVRLNVASQSFDTWKRWERGHLDLAIEMADDQPIPWDEMFSRYHDLGVTELVRLDPQAALGLRLRAWDRQCNLLVERPVNDESTPCLTLGGDWGIAPVERNVLGLSLMMETLPSLPAPTELAAIELRMRELEAELRRLRGGS